MSSRRGQEAYVQAIFEWEEDDIRHLEHAATCPHGNPIPRSGDVEPPLIALSEVPVGERVHVERIPERLGVIAGLLDQLERDGLVRGLTVSVIDRRDDRATLVRTGRGDIWVDADVCDRLLVTVGDIDRITDQLRGVALHHHATSIAGRTDDAS
jgi:hypothetical protein